MRKALVWLGLAAAALLALSPIALVAHGQTAKPRPPQVRTALAPLPLATAGTVHQNTLNWNASPDAAASDSANVYVVSGGCPTVLLTSSFTLLRASVAPAGPFVDTAVSPGKTKSYVVTNVIGGVETGVSNCVSGTTPTFQPQNLTIASQ